MRLWISRPAACLLLLLPLSPIHANDLLFLRGDSYFHCRLAKSDVDRMRAGEPVNLTYAFPENAERSFCGTLGYAKLDTESLSKDVVRMLCDAYDAARASDVPLIQRVHSKDGRDSVADELNPIHVFFYSPDFSFERFRIGLRYNESWIEAVREMRRVDSIEQVTDVTLRSHAFNQDLTTEEWRDSKLVSELAFRATSEDTIRISGDIQIIMIRADHVRPYVMKDEGYSIARIVKGKTDIFTRWRGEWLLNTPDAK